MDPSDSTVLGGAPAEIRRPSDYNPSLAAARGPSQPNPNLNLGALGLSPDLEDPGCISVEGLPSHFTKIETRKLLESFGPLRGFDLVKDRETGKSKGYAFCVYEDFSVTDMACVAFDGMRVGDKILTVRRTNQGPRHPTKVVCLTHLLTEDSLKEDEDFENIFADIRNVVGRYGKLVNLVIPRPNPNVEYTAGVGKVFLEYDDAEVAARARLAMHGIRFRQDQVVIAAFYSETKFAQGEYDG